MKWLMAAFVLASIAMSLALATYARLSEDHSKRWFYE